MWQVCLVSLYLDPMAIAFIFHGPLFNPFQLTQQHLKGACCHKSDTAFVLLSFGIGEHDGIRDIGTMVYHSPHVGHDEATSALHKLASSFQEDSENLKNG